MVILFSYLKQLIAIIVFNLNSMHNKEALATIENGIIAIILDILDDLCE